MKKNKKYIIIERRKEKLMKIVIQIKFLVVNKLKAKKSTKTSNYKTFITFKKSLIQNKIKTAFAGLIAVS